MRPAWIIAIVAAASLAVGVGIVVLDDDDPPRFKDESERAGDDLREYAKRQIAMKKAKQATAIVEVFVHVDGVTVDGARMTDEQLLDRVRAWPSQVKVDFDADVTWDRVIAIMDLLRTAGATVELAK